MTIVTVLCGEAAPDTSGGNCFITTQWDKEVCLKFRISFGYLLILLYSVIKINEKF